MANVLTDLAADIYKAADVVAREGVGFIGACTINGDGSERAAKGDTVRAAFTNAASAVDVTEAMTIPEGTDQTVSNKTMTISKSKAVQIPWTGEDIRHVRNGAGFETVYGAQIAQAMRTLTNLIEVDLATEAYQNSSRAYGTAGTTPFGSSLADAAEIRQILYDNGCPDLTGNGMVNLVLASTAGTNLRSLAQVTDVNRAGSSDPLRNGELLNVSGLGLRESAQVVAHTKGTGSGYLINNASGEVAGQTTLTLDTGSGTIIAGDVLTHASDSVNKYIVNTALSGGDVVIGAPGLLVAAANNNAVTVGNSYTANVAFHRAALELAIRAPAVSADGTDLAVDAMTVQDPISGLVFEIRVYKGYRKTMIEVAAAWGVKAWKPEFIATLLG